MSALQHVSGVHALGALTHGLTVCAILNATTTLFGSGPYALAGAIAVSGGAYLLASRLPPLAWPLSLLSLVFFGLPEDAGRAAIWAAGYGGAPALLAALAVIGGAVLVEQRRGAPQLTALTTAALLLVTTGLPSPVPVLLLLAILLVRRVLPRHGAAPVVPAAPPASIAGGLLLTLVVAAALLCWALGRAPLDPSPASARLLAAAALTAWAIGAARGQRLGRWLAVAGAVVALAAVWRGSTDRVELLSTWPDAGPLLAIALGAGAGAIAGGLRAAPAPALVLGALVLPTALSLTPAAWIASASRGDAHETAPEVTAMRERATTAWTGVDAGGAGAVLEVGDRRFVELDGVLTDADTRQGRAERFAGTLGACVTAARGHARVTGDDLGLVVQGLRPHGFTSIDAATPSVALVRTLAGREPALDRIWLDPSVRLVASPGPFVARSGPAADLVVEVVRTPWSDARTGTLELSSAAATRRGVRSGGAHVVVLSRTVGLETLTALMDTFGRVWEHPSLWLPPEGADTAILVGMDAPIPWSGLERCVTADLRALRSMSIRTGVDIGALAMADSTSIRALGSVQLPDPLAFVRRREDPTPPLAALPSPTVDPGALFIGAPPELAERAETRRLFLAMLSEATGGDARAAFEQARALAALPGGDRAVEPILRPHLDRARAAITRGTREGITSKAWEDASAALTTAQTIAPNHAGTRCLVGEVAGARGDLGGAEDAYAECARLDPERLEAWQGLARARRSLGDLSGTEVALRTASKLDPQAWQTAHNLGLFLLDVQRYDEAERLLRQAMAAQSRTDSTITVSSLALARLYLATNRAELAMAQAERAASIEPTATALALRGAARLELRQLDLAADDFAQALQLDPTSVLARFGTAQVHAVRGEYALAARDFKEVLARDPRNAEARANLQRLIPLVEGGQEE